MSVEMDGEQSEVVNYSGKHNHLSNIAKLKA
jgi:hypothetical protein